MSTIAREMQSTALGSSEPSSLVMAVAASTYRLASSRSPWWAATLASTR